MHELRAKVIAALERRKGDRVPLDLGGCGQTVHVSTVTRCIRR